MRPVDNTTDPLGGTSLSTEEKIGTSLLHAAKFAWLKLPIPCAWWQLHREDSKTDRQLSRQKTRGYGRIFDSRGLWGLC